MFFAAVMANPIGIFIYGIFGRIYLVVMVTAVLVVFWVFKGLDKIGLIKYTQDLVVTVLGDTESIARYCTPHIIEPNVFWDCIGNPSKYKDDSDDPADEENASALKSAVKAIEKTLQIKENKQQPESKYQVAPDNDSPQNPYE